MHIAQVGEAVLKQPAQDVPDEAFGTSGLKNFTAALLKTMLDANGVGIAAPQVFDGRAIMFVASRPSPRYPNAPQMEPLLLINPRIISQSQEHVWEWEGCLSVPALRGFIQRPEQVKVHYQDIDGNPCQIHFEGFLARIFLHEYDHLIGKTWLDHVTSTDQIMAESVWLQQIAGQKGTAH
ncbi:peptide deformylase [Alteromonas gilva]|uniref:Peptide deformylase n=1 Tax=Alteromonas gilva TaxID=2987522 RepID=A0ABT5L624_9ALTE|nr:peptide deformylase [Alteromonas gilva]MDC8832484.1 peptide deformylase [Alteromonas gilva]